MFAAFLEAMRVGANDTILDIEATSDQTHSMPRTVKQRDIISLV